MISFYEMKILMGSKGRVFFFACFLPLSLMQASPIKWEIHQAFPSWVVGERWFVFVEVTNVGNEIIPLSGSAGYPWVQQIRLVADWRNTVYPHSHGQESHTHHLQDVDQPWKSRLKWDDVLKGMTRSRVLEPGQSEVLGDLGLRGIWVENGMPDPHMESFQLALRLGPDRYAISEPQSLVFADVPRIKTYPAIAEIERVEDTKLKIQQIEIDGEKWLFNNSFF